MIKKFLYKVKEFITSRSSTEGKDEKNQTMMPGELQHRINHIKNEFKDANDVVFREFEMHSKRGKRKLFLFYIDGLADKNGINDFILKPLMVEGTLAQTNINTDEPDEVFNSVKNALLAYAGIAEAKTYEEMINNVLSGDTALLIDEHPVALVLSTRSWATRSITPPQVEPSVRGPQEGFVESIRINTSMIRRKIKSSNLKFESMKIGKYTLTDVVVAYIDGIADPKVIQEVKNRLAKIDIDGILESGYIEELIEDNRYSPFPQMEHTERPDKIAGSLLEGRIAIIIDGTPFVIIVPVVFWSFLQASEDYYERYFFASFLRLLRLVTAAIALLGPAVYIAVTTFHQEMLPTSLLLSIAAQREGVPFPAVVEAFALEFSFEILREGGVRLPTPVGQSISIVGALIIGQAAVQAGLVSPAMVIVVAITGIASMTFPAFNIAITFRLLRLPIMIAASVLGFYGIMLSLLLILTHLCALRSFGVPYLSPLAPLHIDGLKDTVIRVPWWGMLRRPRFYQSQNIVRQRSMRGKAK